MKIDYKKAHKLLLEDWNILGKRYMKLQKKYNDIPKRDEDLNNSFLILKEHEKDIKILISCINKLGEEIKELKKGDEDDKT